MLLAVAIGETEVRPLRANPEVLKHHWWKFCALRRVWEIVGGHRAPRGRPCCRSLRRLPAHVPQRPSRPRAATCDADPGKCGRCA